ncbi:MAG: carbon-monoxide dehydrogenase large subunit [Paracoccaceae bacterium]|jgi:carbon-monoxide dehydrogenase large subunit
MGQYALGQSVPRSEDPRLLRGGGRYADDRVLPGMAHGYVLRSPHAHAKINGIDVAAAAAAPGVVAVFTGADWQALGWGDVPGDPPRKLRDGSTAYAPPFPALVSDRVRCVGDCVAFVVAESRVLAQDAAELIEVEYEPLAAGTDTERAVSGDAPLVWDDAADNIAFVHLVGDKTAADAAFEAADHVISKKFVINRVAPATIEPRATLANYDAGEDRYTIYTTLQHANPYRTSLATKVIGVPESKIRVVSGDVGGSYGMKSSIYNENVLVLWASKATGRPVKWTSDRTEAFQSDAQGRDNVTTGELALDKDGRFLGMRVKTIGNIGAYVTQAAGGPLTINLGTLAGVYTTPAIHVDVTAVFSHTTITRPYRGAGRPEAAFVIERLVDLAAAELGINPVDLRRRNTIPEDAMPFKTGLTFEYDCGAFEDNMDMALEMANYTGFEERRREALSRGKLRGIGLSNTIERAAAAGFEGGEIRFDRSGTATVLSGATNHGQGHETVFKQLVCDRLGLDFDDVHYGQGDTDIVPFGQGTGGSRSATIGGSALLMASDKIIDKATEIAAHLMEVAADDIEFHEGVFAIAGTDRQVTITEVAKAAASPASLPAGMEPGLTAQAVYTATEQNYPNGCHVVEVEIDRETGVVDVVGYNVVDDVGTVMNPMLLKGQIHGGVGQGLGQALMEDMRYDSESGQNVTSSFMDYCLPRADDFPMIEVKSNGIPTKTNPLGVKGAGEAGAVGALPAVTNAVIDALAEFGVTHIEMPATPERVWRAMQG